jgi:diadenosine tetraphosphatase ApaH/serine/threonine PP2A family protein phosphatase
MKTAIFTDLHANREAMEAVLDHARGQGAERRAFLGDLVGYGADPRWMVDLMRAERERGAIVLLGNHDAAAVHGAPPTMRPDAARAAEWTRRTLDAERRRFLAELPLTQERGEVLYVHANAWAPGDWEYTQNRSDAVKSLRATRCRIVFCGHMHEPRLYHLSPLGKAGEFTPTPGVPVPLLEHRRWLAIPGAVGQPRDGDPAACYALHDEDAGSLTWFRVPYDQEAAAAKMRAAGLPQRLWERLVDGR